MYSLVLVLVLFGSGKPSLAEHRRFDVMELNHRYDETGRHCYSQVIVWNWKPEVRRHHVESWWIVDTNRLSQLPGRTGSGCRVFLNRDDRRYEIVANVYRETWTVHDPEREDKELWHETRRKGL